MNRELWQEIIYNFPNSENFVKAEILKKVELYLISNRQDGDNNYHLVNQLYNEQTGLILSRKNPKIFSLLKTYVNACEAVYSSDAFLGLANFLPFFLVFAGISTLVQTPAQLRQMSWCLVVPSVPVVMLGLGQMFLGWACLVSTA